MKLLVGVIYLTPEISAGPENSRDFCDCCACIPPKAAKCKVYTSILPFGVVAAEVTKCTHHWKPQPSYFCSYKL